MCQSRGRGKRSRNKGGRKVWTSNKHIDRVGFQFLIHHQPLTVYLFHRIFLPPLPCLKTIKTKLNFNALRDSGPGFPQILKGTPDTNLRTDIVWRILILCDGSCVLLSLPCHHFPNDLYSSNCKGILLHLKKWISFRMSAPGRATKLITSWEGRLPGPKARS